MFPDGEPRLLRGGQVTIDPRLDRVPQPDARNANFPVRTLLPRTAVRAKRTWVPGPVLDQGSEGACVGFAWAGELAASPVRVGEVTNAYARAIYHRAQQLDDWPGESYSGTSVLAGAKACTELGLITEYRWAFTVDEVIDALVHVGPVVLGIDWYDGMYETRPSGLVKVDGAVVGGHAITVHAYHPGMRIRGEGWWRRHEVVTWQNSWGTGYGRGGRGYLTVESLSALMANGEACIPVGRRRAA